MARSAGRQQTRDWRCGMVVGGLAVPRLTCRDRVGRSRYFPHKALSHLARDRGDGSLQSAYIVRERKAAGQRANAARPKNKSPRSHRNKGRAALRNWLLELIRFPAEDAPVTELWVGLLACDFRQPSDCQRRFQPSPTRWLSDSCWKAAYHSQWRDRAGFSPDFPVMPNRAPKAGVRRRQNPRQRTRKNS